MTKRGALAFLLGMGLAAEAAAATRTVDGDPSDWVGVPSATAHTDARSAEEWIHTAVAEDARTDPAGTDETNADLTEMRLTTDGTYLYFLFRLQDVTDVNKVNLAVTLDIDQSRADAQFDWVGPDSDLMTGRPFLRWEQILSFHSISGTPTLELWAGGNWYTLGTTQIAISPTQNVVEARILLQDLAPFPLAATGDFLMTVTSFVGTGTANAGGNSTADIPGSNDAVDVLGVPGQTGNAFDRDLSDGNVYFGWWIQLQGASTAPSAVVFDRLYHSQCDQLKADGCAGGDHPVDQVVPGLGGAFPDPQGDGVTFLNLRRWSEDGTPAPGGSTDVYAYDDETADVYLMAARDDLSEEPNWPAVRVFAGSEQFVEMTDVGDFTGGWNGSGSTNYDIFRATLPVQGPGDVFYSFRVRDGLGGMFLCRNDGDDRSWIRQWLRENACLPTTDFAYTVLDDDITGPSITDVTLNAGQICAEVEDMNTRSGDNDSGILQVLVRSDAVLANVASGGGNTETMPVVSDMNFCASVNFTNPTYYRVEATNGDFDNGRAADRDRSLSSIRCEGASCSGAGASPNNDIWWSEVLHDTRDLYYREPFGAVATGTAITLRLRVADNDLTAAELELYTGSGTQIFPGVQVPDADATYDWYQFDVPGTALDAAETVSYKFKLTDGSDQDWYIDDHAHNHYDHEDRFENGTGIMVDDGSSSQFFDNSFKITVYSSTFTTPDWAKNATMYQILPDRFRNGDLANDANWPFGDVYGTPAYYHALQSVWNEPVNDPREAGPFFQQWSADFFGGDLQGILDKLGYFQSIGVTALYLNPVFAAPSNHGYDTSDYLQINPRFGNNALFQTLATQAEAHGIKIVLDGVFNHTGSDSVYFDRPRHWAQSGACEAAASPFAAFFTFFGTTGPCYDGKNYDSWFGFDTLPLLNENDPVKDFIFDKLDNGGDAVIQQWYALGADGWRFDVADEISHQFWQEFRPRSKAANEGPLYSEVWYEAEPWLYGDQMDATMNYRYRKAVLGFLVDNDFTDNDNDSDRTIWRLNPSQFDYVLRSIQEDYPPQSFAIMMNLMGSHDTNRALFVLRERSSNLNSALAKMQMMAALQLTYPGAPTVYYGDEVGLGARDYGGYGKWGAGKDASGIVQDDPYNRHPYPWTDEAGMLPAGLPNAALLKTYRILGVTRRNYDVLRTGQVVTLLKDDTANVYAYARIDAAAPACAIAIFNRSTGTRNVTLNSVPALCNGTLEDVLNAGADWSVASGTVTVNGIPGLTSAVLVPAFDDPNTPQPVMTLPPANLQNPTHLDLAGGGSTNLTVTLQDIADQPIPAGVAVTFTVVAGGGTLTGGLTTATSLTGAGGQATIGYTAPAGSSTPLIEISLRDPSGVKLCGVTGFSVGRAANVVASASVCAGVGTQTLEAFSSVSAAVTKRGLGEAALHLARFDSSPHAAFGSPRSPFVGVRLGSTANIDSVALRLRYTDETDEANHQLFWWNGSTWQSIPGTTLDTTANEFRFAVTTASSPSLTQLAGQAFVVGSPGAGSTPTFTPTQTATPTFTPTRTFTSTSTRTFTSTPTFTSASPTVVCTPPPCPNGTLMCPSVCPGGCGTICVPWTETPTQPPGSPSVTPSFTATQVPTGTFTPTLSATASQTALASATPTSTGPAPTETSTVIPSSSPTNTQALASPTGTLPSPTASTTGTRPSATATGTESQATATATPIALQAQGGPLSKTALLLVLLVLGSGFSRRRAEASRSPRKAR